MTTSPLTASVFLSHQVFRALRPLWLLLLACTVTAAQTSNTDGTTPSGLSPGAPAGAYALNGFESVRHYNGNLNFALPLLQVRGRGAAQHTIMLTIEQKWRVEQFAETFPNSEPIYTPVGAWWGQLTPGYGPGVLEGRRGGSGDYPYEHHCGVISSSFYEQTLTRLTFTAPDGTEIELRDALTGGTPANLGDIPCESQGASRGTIFVTADGSAATFISDAAISDYKYKPLGTNDQFRPSGYLLMCSEPRK
ncbi:MAG: hypothetical protein ACR2GW_02690 [Pyrinomonadaceae bacterium]